MHLIVGLGNPGPEYQRTRHNVGFVFLDKLTKGERFSFDKKMEGEVLKLKNFVLLKPHTFMNDSGRAVRKIVDFYKMSVESVIVVHDDLDIAFGEYKIQKEKGPKVHNGVKSVEECLGRADFWRVRIGIDNRQPGVGYGTGADYVLSKFSNVEQEELEKMFDDVVKDLAEALGLNFK